MTRRWTAAAVAFAVGAAVGCGTAPGELILDPGRYATACAQASDCVPAFIGNVCQPCSCPNTAIARSSQPLLEADIAGLVRWCADPGGVVCAGCPSVAAGCDAGQCTLELP